MDGAFMKIYMVIHAQKRRRNENNSLENNHLPTLTTWTILKQDTCLKWD